MFNTIPCPQLHSIKGIPFALGVQFRQLLITGPPGSGKTTFIQHLGGWSEEGYIDLTLNKWWTAQSLSLRPREIHLGLPFKGQPQALSVFEQQWYEATNRSDIDYNRIAIPPVKTWFLSVNWRQRYVFEFLIPSVEVVAQRREQRKQKYTHRVDALIDAETLQQQRQVYLLTAHYLHQQGMTVYLREDYYKPPCKFQTEE